MKNIYILCKTTKNNIIIITSSLHNYHWNSCFSHWREGQYTV